ncbi:MAG TPA: glycosyltransferase family 2 protein [Chryseosolibacter sp.]|nr:glycosyltransferase family 2 protein [Chryseosolibacter sp.]
MYLVEIILLVYFSYVTCYAFIFSTAALFYKSKKTNDSELFNRIAVLIPAYKEDAVIVDVAASSLKQRYPSDKYDVVVIADSLQGRTLNRLSQLPIKVIEVSFEKSTKVRALNKAMEVLSGPYECALVLDADNVMEENFLRKMNNLYNLRYKAIQGRREPKNENTKMAVLDGLSETINNFIYRQGHNALGLSSSLNGSGMFFEYKSLKEILSTMDSIGGFDRELEFRLIERGMPVYYAKNVIVFDEKVDKPEVFERQRKRWISSQFFYLRKFFKPGIKALLAGNVNYFNATVLRNMQLPRLMNLGLLTFVTCAAVLLARHLAFSPIIWVVLLILNIASIAFAIPARLYNRNLFKSILLVPSIFVKMFMLFFKLKGANKSFIHTPHGHVEHVDAKNI